ncbi:TonB-dependent receptor [Maribacter litopenaei]|uniref:TonB-dependent receptor n=1 Tax=Maribacter litopenaei TaxID=2976127 RepID=UPI0030845695
MNKLLLLLFLLYCFAGWSQQVTVLDDETLEPIPNVAVFNPERTKISVTDLDGNFDFAPFLNEDRLVLRHLSYETTKVTRLQIVKNDYKIYMVMVPERLDEVVMSISKWEQQKKEIPNKIISIDARTIALNTPQTSADLLQRSGKVFVQKSQLGGGSPMIRGFATNRLVLSVDGVRMNNAIFRGGNLQNVISIDPFNIRNTEIIFGSGSVIYGSDAIGGVMNFYTRQPMLSQKENTQVSGNGNYRFSSANTENTIHADINIGRKNWASLTSFTYNDFQDLKMGSHGPESYLRNSFVRTMNGQDVLVPNNEPSKQVTTGYDREEFYAEIFL